MVTSDAFDSSFEMSLELSTGHKTKRVAQNPSWVDFSSLPVAKPAAQSRFLQTQLRDALCDVIPLHVLNERRQRSSILEGDLVQLRVPRGRPVLPRVTQRFGASCQKVSTLGREHSGRFY